MKVKKQIKSATILFGLAILISTGACQNTKSDKKVDPQRKEIMDMKLNSDTSKVIKVGILVYPGVELLDFSGPAEVFSSAEEFRVYTISSTEKKIATQNETLKLTADYTVNDAPQPDILVLPGAALEVVDSVGDEKIMDWIRKTNQGTTLSMSVCSGALFLSKSGLLDGKRATSHLSVIDQLKHRFPKVQFEHENRFVQDGKIITTEGVSAGIDGALHVVREIAGIKSALRIASFMEYNHWDPQDGLVVHPENVDVLKKRSSRQSKVLDHNTHDVVCGMAISKENSKYHTVDAQREYYFCSASCKKLFEEHPEIYASE